MDGKTLDMALHRNRFKKANLNNYVTGTNATGIMYGSFKPRTTFNGSATTRTTIYCYITIPPYDAESEFLPGPSWWQILSPTKMHESNRNKRIRQTLDYDDSSEEKEIKDDDSGEKSISLIDVEQEPMRINTASDLWDDTKVWQLFLPNAGEHPKDTIAR